MLPLNELSGHSADNRSVSFSIPFRCRWPGSHWWRIICKTIVGSLFYRTVSWFEEDGWPFWFSPDPRCVLIPAQLKVSGSMRVLFNKQAFRVTFDQDFEAVIRNCAEVHRAGQEETWISEHFIKDIGACTRQDMPTLWRFGTIMSSLLAVCTVSRSGRSFWRKYVQ